MRATACPIPCSVVLLTFNEEINIADAIRSVESFAEVVVIDSFSSDRTVDIARQAGARVLSNPFVSFAQQRNWAHDHASLNHGWVLHLDADERMTAELQAQIAVVVEKSDPAVGGYYLAEKTMLDGRWLRRAAQFPRYQARLMNSERARFVDHGHGQRESSEYRFQYLSAPYLHHAFSHGMDHWLIKHAKYAVQEAHQGLIEARDLSGVVIDLFSTDRSLRRRAVKYIAMHLPCRPFLRWLYVLIVKRGLLDGRPGLQYARMMWLFQQMIDFSLDAARRQQSAGNT